MKKILCSNFLLLLIIAFGCKDDDGTGQTKDLLPDLPEVPFAYTEYQLPDHFLDSPFVQFFENEPANNQTTDEGATLGRVLFYDKNLSLNTTISCASCHLSEHGFSDPRQFSLGFDGESTSRQSMTLANHRFSTRLFWDTRVGSLETQVLLPIQDHIEMGMTIDGLVERLEALPYYPDLFAAAFENEKINEQNISFALSQFVRSMLTYQSKFDVAQADDFASFTSEEKLGHDLFISSEIGCSFCHLKPLFNQVGQALHNGLEIRNNDLGFGGVTGEASDEGKFKVPTLRNVERTAPYMHDGRFATLEEVLEHYSTGISAHPNLDDRLTTDANVGGPPKQFNLSEGEKSAIITFLKTLTDEVYLNDPKFQDPFL